MKRSVFSLFERDERGAVAVLFGMACPVLMGAAGIGAEVAYWQHNVRKLQNASDAAAFSGAGQLTQGKDAAAIEAAAKDMALASGFTTAGGGVATVNTPPTSGAFTGDSEAVEVVLNGKVPRLFTGLFLASDFVDITARSVAKGAGNRPSCVLALDQSASPSILFDGSTDVILDGCDIAANSVADTAIKFKGSAKVEADCVSAVGGISDAGNALTLGDCNDVFENSRITPDPFASVGLPTDDGCGDQTLRNALSGLKNGGPVVTVYPGTVCNKDFSLKGKIHFSPGTYFFKNSDIQFTAQATVTGTGVTFVLLGNSEIDMNGGPDIQLSAPTDPSDPLVGMLFMSDAAAAERTHSFRGNSGNSFNGAIYLPNAHLTFSGNSTASAGVCTLLIAKTVEFTGSSYLNSDCTSLGLSSPETAQIVLIVE